MGVDQVAINHPHSGKQYGNGNGAQCGTSSLCTADLRIIDMYVFNLHCQQILIFFSFLHIFLNITTGIDTPIIILCLGGHNL